jgi:hypothetical protein
LNRWPLSRLQAEVGKVRFSLKVIPWEFDKPVSQGDVKLRRCAGCPHNTETDRTLFGIDEDAANPRGYCLNPACYNAKQAEAAKEQVLKKIAKRQVQTPEAIRKASPEWLKESSVIGYVKRQLDKAERNGGEIPEATPRTTRSYGRTLTAHELALKKFTAEFDAWEKSAFESVLAGVNAEPQHRVSWCVLLGVDGLWDHPRVQIPRVSEYGNPCTEEPVVPTLPGSIQKAIKLAFKATRSGWLELLTDSEQASPDERSGFGIPHPGVLELIGKELGIELPPVPQWTPPVPPSPAVAAEIPEAIAA